MSDLKVNIDDEIKELIDTEGKCFFQKYSTLFSRFEYN